jgi:hypothetical protein
MARCRCRNAALIADPLVEDVAGAGREVTAQADEHASASSQGVNRLIVPVDRDSQSRSARSSFSSPTTLKVRSSWTST